MTTARDPVAMSTSPALPDATASDAALRRFLLGLPGVDKVGAEDRVDRLARRSTKRESKLQTLALATTMTDLTTLEGMETPGRVRNVGAKARRRETGLRTCRRSQSSAPTRTSLAPPWRR